MVYKDTTNSGDLKEEVVKARKEEGQDYFDDYEREKKVFQEDSNESEAFGIDKFEDDSNEFGDPKSEWGDDYEDSYELESDEDDEDSDDSEYFEDNSDYYYESNESDSMESLEDSNISEDGRDYADDDDNVKDDPGSLRKTFYQSHIYPMHLLENLKV